MLNRVFIITLLILLFISCTNSEEYKKYTKTTYAMGTTLEIIIFSKDKKIAERIIDESIKLAENLEKKVSCKIDDSPISILNKKKELLIKDDFIFNLIKESYYFASITNGTFDPSLYNLTKLWGFEEDKNIVPDKESIKKTLLTCGYKNIIIDEKVKKVTLRNNVSIDLGGIAKGRIVDEIVNFIKSNNIKDFIVNAGGDLYACGLFQGKRKWKIAIADPFTKNDIIGLIDVTDIAVVTSGDYERFFVGEDGNIYHHILNPFTGYPANNGIHSVTVIAKDTISADSLSTAFFVMGKENTLEFVKNNKELWVILISGTKDKPEIDFSQNISSIKETTNRWIFELR